MMNCRTDLTNKNIRALAKYHSRKTKKNKKKSILIFILGLFLLAVSTVNAYGLWMKYHEAKSILYIISKSSVLFFLSFVILHTSIWGTTQRLYVELNNYFTKLKADFIDYEISNAGITLVLKEQSTLHAWNSISSVEYDSNYYYFACDKKYSIIAKNKMDSDMQKTFEAMLLEKNIPFCEFKH